MSFLAIIISIVVVLLAYCKWQLTYWKRIGLPTLSPKLLFGDTKKFMFGELTVGQQFQEFYKTFKARGYRYGGVYLGLKPFYLAIDPEIIKNILFNDFQHFVNHGTFVDEDADPLSGHLFNLEDEKWKTMRAKLTPTFTSGKMKMMFQTMLDCTLGLQDIMDELAVSRTAVEIRDLMARFTTDVIGSVAFGFECNSLKDPETPFRIYGKKAFELKSWERLKFFLQFILPFSLLKAMKFRITNPEVSGFFQKVISDTVAYREQNKIYRKDFMHLLLQLKNRGKVVDDEYITEQNKVEEKGLTMNEISAQAFVFFAAGFETSSTTMSWAIYELALNQSIQEKLRTEINSTLVKYDNQFKYDAIMEMVYLEKVIKETLRKYPPGPVLQRRCTKDYVIPGTNVILKKDIDVAIPIFAIHSDPDYYPSPEKFDPERFSEESSNTRPNVAWIPFGDGPRLCIGMRFGMLQIKVGLTALLKNYKLKVSRKTKLPIEFDKTNLITSAEGGIWVDIEKLDRMD